MKIVQTSGGLGNQMYQYILMRYLEIISGKEHYISDLLYMTDCSEHNGFELDKIFPNIELKTLSTFLGEETTNQIIEKKIKCGDKNNFANLFNEFDIKTDFLFSQDIGWGQLPELEYFIGNRINIGNSDNLFSTIKPHFNDDYFIIGTWHYNKKYENIREKMLKELAFKDICKTDIINIKYMDKIKSSSSVGVHIRRGDFVSLEQEITAEKYAPTIKEIRDSLIKKKQKPVFFVFSNELDWCENNFLNLGFLLSDEIIYVKGNMTDARNYIDMQLMSNCKYLVYHSRSSFVKLAVYLNENLIKSYSLHETPKERNIRLINASPYQTISNLEIKITNLEKQLKTIQNFLDNEETLQQKKQLQLEKKESNKYKGQARYYKKKYENITSSISYKLGRIITWLPRKIRGVFK